jgi:regulator of protease activity HflC (stomatin/prohibitin superfamily)
VKKVPTADNVFVSIDVEVVFKILRDEANIRAFAYNLGPPRLEKLLQAFLEESIRTMARMKTYSKVFDLMDSAADEQLENTKRRMNENLSTYG